MQLSTSFLSQANFDTSISCRKIPIDMGFQYGLQSSNINLAPSRYPMNSFYHQQIPMNPTIISQSPRFSYDPSKKIKINDNSERIVQNNIHAQLSQMSQDTPSKKIYEVRVPNIPSKTIFPKQNGMELQKHNIMPNIEIKQREKMELLMKADATAEDFNMFYEKKIESFQQELEIQKKLFLHQVIKGKIKEYAKWLRSVQSQSHLNSGKSTETKSPEEILREQFITRHIKQNVLPLLKLCKKNQADLAQYLKSPILEGLQKQEDSSQTIFDNIYKLEAETINVKEEGLH